MSLFIGKSNKSCNEVSQEYSSSSLELDEEWEPIFLSLQSKSSFTTLASVVEDPTGLELEAKSIVIADTDPHLFEHDPKEIGLWQLLFSSDLCIVRKDSPTSEFHIRRK